MGKAFADAVIPYAPQLVAALIAAALAWLAHFKMTMAAAQNAVAKAENTVPPATPGSPRLTASRNMVVRQAALENFNQMGTSALLAPRARERLINRVADAAASERVTRG